VELADKTLVYRGAEPVLAVAMKQFDLVRGARIARKVWKSRRDLPRPWLRQDPPYRLLTALHELDRLPLQEKRQTALFIPRANRAYWDLVSDPTNACLAPALSGLCMVDGLPLKPAAAPGHCCYNRYSRAGQGFIPDDDTEGILRRARDLGFRKVLVVEMDTEGAPRFRYLQGAMTEDKGPLSRAGK
jgi:hypothetical protein